MMISPDWIPAFAGMTGIIDSRLNLNLWIPAFAGMIGVIDRVVRPTLWTPAFAGVTMGVDKMVKNLDLCIPVFSVMLCTVVEHKKSVILHTTHPPRLSGYYREAQPWWVFYACLAGGIYV